MNARNGTLWVAKLPKSENGVPVDVWNGSETTCPRTALTRWDEKASGMLTWSAKERKVLKTRGREFLLFP